MVRTLVLSLKIGRLTDHTIVHNIYIYLLSTGMSILRTMVDFSVCDRFFSWEAFPAQKNLTRLGQSSAAMELGFATSLHFRTYFLH